MKRQTTLALSMLLGLLLALGGCSGDDTAEDEDTGATAKAEIEGRLVSADQGTLGFIDFSTTSVKSFGLFVCAEGADVTVESVEAIASSGSIEVIGGLYYAEPDNFVGAVNGFPPVGVDEEDLVDLEGATVRNRCASAEDGRSQVLVGAERTDGAGGRIDGIRINYAGGTLELPDYDIVLCGDEMEFCGDVEQGGA